MPRGGARIGAGRKAGSTDAKFGKVSADRVLNATGTGPDKMPLAYMLAVMNDIKQKTNVRLQAAIAAAPYVHPRLASVEVKSESNATLTIESDLGKALKELAEIARLRDFGPVIEGEVLEPATLEEPDTLSTDILSTDTMTGGHFDQEDEEGGEERQEEGA